MINNFISLFSPGYPSTIIYMLQSEEYHIIPYLKWYWRTVDFGRVSKRRSLDKTAVARLLKLFLLIGIAFQIMVSVILIFRGLNHNLSTTIIGLALLLSYPVVWAHLIIIPTIIGRLTIINRRDKKLSHQTKQVFGAHKATIIAVAGSYGKTSMKELLATVLSEAKKVAFTPANKNVITEHAKFARNLKGDEDVVIVEYGEEKPGDILKFAAISQPNMAVITGLAPAHLDKYKSLAAAGKDIFTLAEYLNNQAVYVNGESSAVKQFLKPGIHVYNRKGIGGNIVSEVKVNLDGTQFDLKLDGEIYHLKSGLIGEHQIGPLCAAAMIAKSLGLSKAQIEKGVARTKSYEHRMEPKLIAGAWVLDDTYNGTIEGMKAGLELLKKLKAKRKIYVTPGLVDQGDQAHKVHNQLGKYIADNSPDLVVLMENSATDDIVEGLKAGNYNGELNIQTNPLEYYSNLDKVVAVGDLVLMQNDWTDNYN